MYPDTNTSFYFGCTVNINSYLDMMRNVSFDWSKILRSILIYQENFTELPGKNITWSVVPADYPACQVMWNLKMSLPTLLLLRSLKWKISE